MLYHAKISRNDLRTLIREGKITKAGNARLKIYGLLTCRSGKRMKTMNRVFFEDEHEALNAGYRACGHCQREKYNRKKQVESSMK
jgi:methylphosphotriester-DNA--protein-cysteine methyltransferase